MKFNHGLTFPKLLAGLCLVCLFLGLGWSNAAAQEGEITQVSIVPQSGTMTFGSVLNVEVWVANVEDLYGVDLEIAFPSSAFEVIDADAIKPGVQITVLRDFLNPLLLVYQEADPLLGTVHLVGTQLYPQEAVSGSGALFSFQLRALTIGNFPLSFITTELAGTGASVIAHTRLEAAIQVVDGVNLYLPIINR